MSSSASRPPSGSGSGGASGGGGMLIRVDPAPSSAADAPGHSSHAAASADEEPEASQALLSATGNEPARPLSATPSPSPAPPSGIGPSASPAQEGQSVGGAPHHGQFTRRLEKRHFSRCLPTVTQRPWRLTDRQAGEQGGRRECTTRRMLTANARQQQCDSCFCFVTSDL